MSRFRTPTRLIGSGGVLLALLLTGGCRGDSADRPEEVPAAPPAPGTPFTLRELRQAAYPSDLLDGAALTLHDGVYPTPGSVGEVEAGMELIEPVALGTLPGVGPVAAVVIRESGGGTGTFSWLHLIVRTSGRPSVAASAYLGDRVELTGLRFLTDTIEVRLVTQGPSDPLCCPTLVVDRWFLREGTSSTLREVGGKQ
jgi:hypothetical protein